jgi:hypothetical protein
MPRSSCRKEMRERLRSCCPRRGRDGIAVVGSVGEVFVYGGVVGAGSILLGLMVAETVSCSANAQGCLPQVGLPMELDASVTGRVVAVWPNQIPWAVMGMCPIPLSGLTQMLRSLLWGHASLGVALPSLALLGSSPYLCPPPWQGVIALPAQALCQVLPSAAGCGAETGHVEVGHAYRGSIADNPLLSRIGC